MSWRIHGTYFESCNCDPICPCRRIDGVPGGRSTHGVCMGVLSWLIEDGAADGTDVSGLPVALACRYSDDEPGSPWIRDRVSVRIRDRRDGGETVTCVIPGHERAGEELLADELVVEDGPLAFSYRGVCGFGSTFDYAGA
jgi:hypothetical protein